MSRLQKWLPPIFVFGVALAVYSLSSPSGLTWANDSADGGDLIAAALVSGVPHPPGYPTYTLLARLFTYLPFNTPAWRVSLLSSICGALAASLVAAIVQLLISPHLRRDGHLPGESKPDIDTFLTRPALQMLVAATAGLMLAFAPTVWGQSTVVEVYALHMALATAMVFCLLRWRFGGNVVWMVAAGLVFGLTLGNHLTSIWLVSLVILFLWDGLRHRRSGGQAWIVPAVFVFASLAGLTVYAYLPLASAGRPPINWGNIQGTGDFWWLATGLLYRPFVFAVDVWDALGRLIAWVAMLWRDFLPWGIALALLGIALAFRRNRMLVSGALLSLFLGLMWAISFDTSDSVLTLLPGWAFVAVTAGLGLAAIAGWLVRFDDRGGFITWVLCLALVIIPLVIHWPAQNLRRESAAEDFVETVLSNVAPNALLLTVGDRATFALWYARYGLGVRPDVMVISRDLWYLDSYRETVGYTHPALAGDMPSVMLPEVLRDASRQRPVYVTAASEGSLDLASMGFSESDPFQLIPVDLTGPGGEGLPGGLWQLLPAPRGAEILLIWPVRSPLSGQSGQLAQAWPDGRLTMMGATPRLDSSAGIWQFWNCCLTPIFFGENPGLWYRIHSL
ncbi:MAG: DUF2723 domain-containing protein [Chloroflexota bacterium]|nr:DUF2723 domain-containing protein [Chloroflexota bacterium]